MLKSMNIDEAAKIYSEYLVKHFPKDEVKPFENIRRMWDEDCYRVYGFLEDNELKGYGFICNSPKGNVLLLDYLAVLEEYRNQKLGSRFLSALTQELSCQQRNKGYDEFKGIIIETEVAERSRSNEQKEQRERRDAFYLRNGVIKTDLVGTVYAVDYRVWFLPIQTTTEEVNLIKDDKKLEEFCVEQYDILYKFMLSQNGYENFFKETIVKF